MDRKAYREKWEEKVIELRKSDPAVEKIFRGEELPKFILYGDR